jgi:hypothetical protein
VMTLNIHFLYMLFRKKRAKNWLIVKRKWGD